jgi:hypothetical protein
VCSSDLGYLLYPYRASAVKNRQRWNFGVIAPQDWMETQCLATGGPLTVLSVKVRCLRLMERVGESWEEATECEMKLPEVRFAELEAGSQTHRFHHPALRTEKRAQEALDCLIETSAAQVQGGLYRIAVRILNTTPLPAKAPAQALLSAHTILRVDGGEFVSLLEFPADFQDAAAACHNTGTWPVLAGETGARDTMLSSPIILYDYPQIAPESPGDLFDGAEIDEILSLRILTLTDQEKEEMRHTDDRARRILERTENLPPEHFMKLHGVLRNL